MLRRYLSLMRWTPMQRLAWANLLAFLLFALWVRQGHAHGHPLEHCDPGNPSVCSKAGEDQDITFRVKAWPGDVVSIPLSFRDLRTDTCEFGVELAYDAAALGYPTFRWNVDQMTPEECNHLFNTEGGCFDGTTLPEPSLVFFTTPGGSTLPPVECPSCTGLARLRAWAYSGDVAPQYPLGSKDRVLGYWDFPVRESAAVGIHSVVQVGAWVHALDPAGQGVCSCPTQGIGRECSGATSVWEDVPDGLESNQIEIEVPCWSADSNGDRSVGTIDFGAFKAQWGTSGPACAE